MLPASSGSTTASSGSRYRGTRTATTTSASTTTSNTSKVRPRPPRVSSYGAPPWYLCTAPNQDRTISTQSEVCCHDGGSHCRPGPSTSAVGRTGPLNGPRPTGHTGEPHHTQHRTYQKLPSTIAGTPVHSSGGTAARQRRPRSAARAASTAATSSASAT